MNLRDSLLRTADQLELNALRAEVAALRAAPTPHPLDAACEQLRGLAHGRTVALTVREDGSVTIHRPSGDVEAHLTGADGLPLPSAALAAIARAKGAK